MSTIHSMFIQSQQKMKANGMSYSGRQMNSGYTPSYSTHNTGAAYMARRGWDNTDRLNETNSISFNGRRTSKRIVILIIALLCLLLLAAIVIIILFATGVLSSNSEELISSSTYPIYPPTRPPSPPQNTQNRQNVTYTCSFVILRQANAAYEIKNSNNYQAAFRMVRNALLTVIYQSTLQPLGVVANLQDLQNRQDDLEVYFQLTFPSSAPIDNFSIANVLRADLTKFQAQLGENITIDPNTITVRRS